MKYWGFFAAKILVAAGLLAGLWAGLKTLLPKATTFMWTELQPMGHDLTYSLTAYTFWLLVAGALYLIILDQKYRCRTCLRRLRMPVTRGSWNRMFLVGKPHTEYICTYGHGTLKVPDLQFTGKEPLKWAEHQDIWKELELMETSKD